MSLELADLFRGQLLAWYQRLDAAMRRDQLIRRAIESPFPSLTDASEETSEDTAKMLFAEHFGATPRGRVITRRDRRAAELPYVTDDASPRFARLRRRAVREIPRQLADLCMRAIISAHDNLDVAEQCRLAFAEFSELALGPASSIDDWGAESIARERLNSLTELIRDDAPVAAAHPAPIRLRGVDEQPLVAGELAPKLTRAQYDVVRALVEHDGHRLTGDRLVEKSGRGDAVKILKRLAQREPWRGAIDLPGKSGRHGYAIKIPKR